MESEILSNREIRRYLNQMDLDGFGLQGQEKIKQARVVVVGSGGMGTTVMQHMVASGIGYLGIIDNTIVEESNIHRQTLYGTSDLGKQKAIISKQKLQDLNAQVEMNIHNLCINYDNLDHICQNYGYVVDATNSVDSNKAIWEHCANNDKVLLYGIQNEFECEIGMFSDQKMLKEWLAAYPFAKREYKKGYLSAIAGVAGALLSIELLCHIVGVKSKIENQSKKIKLTDIID
jgi:sulfur-carrier protein adenylyltransferase/sulfurtransferase